MFDIGWQELFIVAVMALIVVGPKDLPRVLRTVMGLVRKARMMARDFQDGLDEVVREADLDDMKKKIENLSDQDITEKVQEALDPTGGIADDLNMTEIQEELDTAAKESLNVEETAEAEPGIPETAGPESLTAEPSRSVGKAAKTPDSNSEKDA